MKKFMTMLSMMAVMAAFLLTSACGGDPNKANLKREIENADKDCPISMGIGGDIISMKYDEQQNMVKLYFSINEELSSIDAMKKNDKILKQTLRLSFSNSDFATNLAMMEKAGAGLELTYKGSSSGKSHSVSITPEEVKELSKSKLTDLEIKQMTLENQLIMQNSQFPQDLGDGLQIVKVFDNGDNIVYEYRVEESTNDISVIEENIKQLRKEIMKDFFKDPSIKNEASTLCQLGKDLTLRYVGDKSGKSVDVTFTTDEMLNLIR